MLHGELLPNNSAVALEDIGTDENALFCLSDNELVLRGRGWGDWYFPNQTQVPGRYFVLRYGNTMYRNRGDGIIFLHRLSGGVEGVYRCNIPNNASEIQSLFIKVYSLYNGKRCVFLVHCRCTYII